MKHVSLVMVNWNGIKDTSVALDSIKKLNKHEMVLDTIVVDNGSTDSSVVDLEKKYPWVHLVKTGKNLGFTGGNNVGISEALGRNAEYIWLLNNDTIVDKDALKLVDAFDDASVGIAGSKIYFAPGHEYHKARYSKKEQGKVFWFAGGVIDWQNMYASHFGVDEVDNGQYDKKRLTDFITGCSMMIRREVIEKIGMLDDAYYLYYEDVDYSLRAKNAGYSLMYYPMSVVWHVNAGSTGGAGNTVHEYYQTRNRLLVGMRYAKMRTKIALIREAIRFVISGSAIKRKAIVDALFGRWGKRYEPKKLIA
jgi:GT2 family glycosyltransferase